MRMLVDCYSRFAVARRFAQTSAFASLILFSFSASAGGFQANLQGIKQNGMAQTGVGTSLDAASVFLNPGAMSFLKHRMNFNVGANFVIPTISYQSTDG